MTFERVSRNRMFGGYQDIYRHDSSVLGTSMNVGVYLPPQAGQRDCPAVMWLSGLTCSEQNFVTKAGAQRRAAELGLILIAADTSPRGDDVADADSYDLGQGAGFYVNATESPWARHYRMYDYIVDELPTLLASSQPMTGKMGIMGHSMGGHGALVIGLKNPQRYRSISAFSPIVAPSQCPWGEKALTAYLGADRQAWLDYDATALVATQGDRARTILIDQGEADDFLAEQLQPALFQAACTAAEQPLTLRMQPGYDHSYYFIASFIADHLEHHAAALMG